MMRHWRIYDKNKGLQKFLRLPPHPPPQRSEGGIRSLHRFPRYQAADNAQRMRYLRHLENCLMRTRRRTQMTKRMYRVRIALLMQLLWLLQSWEPLQDLIGAKLIFSTSRLLFLVSFSFAFLCRSLSFAMSRPLNEF